MRLRRLGDIGPDVHQRRQLDARRLTFVMRRIYGTRRWRVTVRKGGESPARRRADDAVCQGEQDQLGA
jgi:hypothetical protein